MTLPPPSCLNVTITNDPCIGVMQIAGGTGIGKHADF